MKTQVENKRFSILCGIVFESIIHSHSPLLVTPSHRWRHFGIAAENLLTFHHHIQNRAPHFSFEHGIQFSEQNNEIHTKKKRWCSICFWLRSCWALHAILIQFNKSRKRIVWQRKTEFLCACKPFHFDLFPSHSLSLPFSLYSSRNELNLL